MRASRRLARARNYLLYSTLRDEDWVLWLDADLRTVPRSLLRDLLAANESIVAADCVLASDGKSCV